MPPKKKPQTINVKYVVITLAAVVLSWMLHEFAHWFTGELLGNNMTMTLNTCYPESGKYLAAWHEIPISTAGPLITLLQAIIFYVLLKRNTNYLLFPFLYTCLYMRVLAGVLNFINLNDEGRIGKALGIGVFTVPVLMIGILLLLTYNTIKEKRFGTWFIVATTLLVMLFSSIIILADQAYKVIIIR